MKLREVDDIDVLDEDDFESEDFGIDEESMGMFFRGFSDNLYSNKIGSIVREITSNCFDAHAEAGTTEAVRIALKTPDPFSPGSITFQDFGVGLSPDRIKNTYRKYFASTKRDSNGQIGGFGIGAKSPLAYTDVFTLITRVDGVEYHYLVHKGAKKPRIEPIDRFPTHEPNGTQVVLPVKHQADFERFQYELHQQLRYFDNIDFEGCDVGNDYRIYRGDSWIYRHSDDPCDKVEVLELCVGMVRYPLSVEMQAALGITGNAANFALRFEIGEVDVTMNREAIDYNDRTVALINERFAQLKEELKVVFMKRNQTDDLLEYNQMMQSGAMVPLGNGARLTGVDKLLGYKLKPVYVPFLNTPLVCTFSAVEGPFFFIETLKEVGRAKTRRGGNTLREVIRYLEDRVPLFRLRDRHIPGKDTYILQEITKGTPFVTIAPKKYEDVLYSVAKLWEDRIGTSDPQWIKFYRAHVMKYLVARTASYEDTHISDAYRQAQKDAREQENAWKTAKTTVTVRTFECAMGSYGWTNFRQEERVVSDYLTRLPKGCRVIYGWGNDHELLTEVGKLLMFHPYLRNRGTQLDPNRLRIIKIAQSNLKYFMHHPQCVNVHNYIEKPTSPFYRMLQRVYWRSQLEPVYPALLTGHFSHWKSTIPHVQLIKRIAGEVGTWGRDGWITPDVLASCKRHLSAEQLREFTLRLGKDHPPVDMRRFLLDLTDFVEKTPLLKLLTSSELGRDDLQPDLDGYCQIVGLDPLTCI